MVLLGLREGLLGGLLDELHAALLRVDPVRDGDDGSLGHGRDLRAGGVGLVLEVQLEHGALLR